MWPPQFRTGLCIMATDVSFHLNGTRFNNWNLYSTIFNIFIYMIDMWYLFVNLQAHDASMEKQIILYLYFIILYIHTYTSLRSDPNRLRYVCLFYWPLSIFLLTYLFGHLCRGAHSQNVMEDLGMYPWVRLFLIKTQNTKFILSLKNNIAPEFQEFFFRRCFQDIC